MNKNKNTVVAVVDWLVNTLAETLVSLFDGLKRAVDHSNPSLFALVATLLPFALPLPVAFMTSHSAQTFFEWDRWAANVLGFGLEGLGLLVWVTLVEGLVARITSAHERIEDFVGFLWCVAIAYEVLLVLINVVLALNEGASGVYALALFLVCLLPALSAAMYSIHRRKTVTLLENERKEQAARDEQKRQEDLALQERIRQERRQDAQRRAELRYASTVNQPELQEGETLPVAPFRRPRRSRRS